MVSNRIALLFVSAAMLAATGAEAQNPPPAYGPPIGIAAAKQAAAAAVAEAARVSYAPDVIAIVDPGGHLVYLERMDNAQIGSIRVAIDKARSAALFRRPSKVFQDALAKGNTSVLMLHGAVALDGGLPLVSDGKVVGAIGASGGAGEQDAKVAKAGADTVK
jgi:glc operon protein GlcG